MDIKKTIGDLADKVSEDNVMDAIGQAKDAAKKLNNDTISKAVDGLNIKDSDVKGALDTLKKLND